jgi:hypothetical protein
MTDANSFVSPSGEGAPDPSRRQLLNLLTFGAVTGVVVGALYPALCFFLPPQLLALGTGGPPAPDLLVEPEPLREELAGLELLVPQERQRPIDEGPCHQGMSAVVQAVGRKPDANRT